MNNTRVLLASRPVGMPTRDNWSIETVPAEQPVEGEFLAEVLYISLDPAMRGWVKDAKSYLPPVGIDEVMRAGGVARVIESRNPAFAVGDHVVGTTGVQSHWLSNGKGARKVDPAAAPLPKYLGVLGMPGMTAYFGILDIGAIQEGETVLVSGAAGAVGSLVGQIAKLKGCRVVGIAGGKEKCDYLTGELGFDAAIDYKSESLYPALKAACPKGIDVYFDNVGGETLDAALAMLRFKGRVALCGAISQYNSTEPVRGPQNYLSLLINRGRMEGFIVFDFEKDFPRFARDMSQWLAEGKLQSREHIVKGIETFPDTLLMLFDGRNQGKLVIEV
ncbi:MAG: NADP-dependent oxidoreductase [Xanthomonadales bacterium]|jgi:NADPH-dependent curcumin reductase CurA|nr:NADP-dependent oxidoreductase [Xanthomonadales bacterium]